MVNPLVTTTGVVSTLAASVYISSTFHFSSSQEPKCPVKLGGSIPCLMSMIGVSPSLSLGQDSRYSFAILTHSCCSCLFDIAPNQAKIVCEASRSITSSCIKSSWSKSTISSTDILPVAFDSWNSLGGLTSSSSFKTFSSKYGCFPPNVSQKCFFS